MIDLLIALALVGLAALIDYAAEVVHLARRI